MKDPYADYRKIIHVDMDAFYASVEQRDNPALRGKPIAVGGGNERGVVATASYEARQFGVKSAMPSITAKRLCKDLIFVKTRMDVYRQVSQQIRKIFFEYTDLVEPLSLDEAYLDVTQDKKGIGVATQIADEILSRITEVTELTASAGVSYNKFIAKIASDLNKPNGKAVILPSKAEAFLETLPVRRFHGIGKATAQKMYDLNIHTGADLKAASLELLSKRFGKSGQYYYNVVRGRDERPVKTNRISKSVSAEKTFSENKRTIDELHEGIDDVSQRLIDRIEKAQVTGHTLTLKVKYADFEIVSRSITVHNAVATIDQIQQISQHLLQHVSLHKAVRLIGIGISGLKTQQTECEPQSSFNFC